MIDFYFTFSLIVIINNVCFLNKKRWRYFSINSPYTQRNTDIQTDGQTNKKTNRCSCQKIKMVIFFSSISKERNKQSIKTLLYRIIDRQTFSKTYRQTVSRQPTDCQTDKQAGRYTDKPADRHTERQTHRQLQLTLSPFLGTQSLSISEM